MDYVKLPLQIHALKSGMSEMQDADGDFLWYVMPGKEDKAVQVIAMLNAVHSVFGALRPELMQGATTKEETTT